MSSGGKKKQTLGDYIHEMVAKWKANEVLPALSLKVACLAKGCIHLVQVTTPAQLDWYSCCFSVWPNSFLCCNQVIDTRLTCNKEKELSVNMD